jgi:hypothetical protein
MGDLQINLVAKHHRKRPSHAIALEVRQRYRQGRIAGRGAGQGGGAAAGPAGDGHPAGRNLRSRCDTRRAVAEKVREAMQSVPFIVDVDDSYGVQSDRLRLALPRKIAWSFSRSIIATCSRRSAVLWRHHRLAIRIAAAGAGRSRSAGAAEIRAVLDERALSLPVPANLLPGDRAVVELGDVTCASRPEERPIRCSAATGGRRRW